MATLEPNMRFALSFSILIAVLAPHHARPSRLAAAIDLADADVDFLTTDVVLVMATRNATQIAFGPTFVGFAGAGGGLNADGVQINNGITSGADLPFWGGLWLNHEMGHSLSLVDLHSFTSPEGFTRPFSMMD